MSDGFYFEGQTELLGSLDKVAEGSKAGARKGLILAAENTLGVSNKQVPYEEGDLARDGGTSIDDETLRAAVSYGRTADTKDYAVPQHERLDYKHDSGRNAKFLENAMNSTRSQNVEIIAAQIRKGMGT